jgi:hypothetical protein
MLTRTVLLIAFGSPDYFSISPQSLWDLTLTHLLNFVAPGQILLPGQSQ